MVIKLFGFVLIVLVLANTASSSNKTSLEWAKTAEHSIKQAGFFFSGAWTFASSYNATKSGHAWSTMSKVTSRLAGVFGAIGAMISAILAFIPGGESPELTLMKSEFGKLSQQIDTVSRSLDETKNLIKIETQKAAYVAYERNIHFGYSQMNELMEKLESVRCSNLTDCKRKKVLVAESYVKSLDVRKSVVAIFRAVTLDSTFGTSFLSLIKRETNCNIPKLNIFTNKVTALITKGLACAIFHDILTKHDYDFSDDTVLSSNMLTTLESKRQAIQDVCFEKFDYWMSRDVKFSHSRFTSDVQNSNTNLLRFLKNKYPWIIWHAITCKGDDKIKPEIGPRTSVRRLLHSTSKSLNVYSIVIPTMSTAVEKLDEKIKTWIEMIRVNNIGDDVTNDVSKIEKAIKDLPELAREVQSFAILPGSQWVLGSYTDDIKQHTLGASGVNVSKLNVFAYKPSSTKNVIVVVSFNQVDNSPKCSSDFCSNKGDCYVYPYSTQKGCKCKKGYGGNKCETQEENQKLKLVIGFLLKNTMKLPTFASIQHSIEDTQLYLKTSSENIQESIRKLGDKIDQKFKDMGEFMSNEFNWMNVLLKYKDSIDNLYYFHSISKEKIFHFQSNTTAKKGRFSMIEEKDIANFMLSPMGIQKWLYHINFLIVGRTDSQFHSHKPLLFMAMDKYKNRFCFADYKEVLTRAYRQLMLLQLQGYMLWSNAYGSVNRDSSVIAGRYAVILKNQQNFLQKATCHASIPHSLNLQDCTGGYFIHKSQKVSVTCQDGYFHKGKMFFSLIYQ